MGFPTLEEWQSERGTVSAQLTEIINEAESEDDSEEEQRMEVLFGKMERLGVIELRIRSILEAEGFSDLETVIKTLGLEPSCNTNEWINTNDAGVRVPDGPEAKLAKMNIHHECVCLGEDSYRLLDICAAVKGKPDLIRSLLVSGFQVFGHTGASGQGDAAGNRELQSAFRNYVYDHKTHKYLKMGESEECLLLDPEFVEEFIEVEASIYGKEPETN